MSDNDKTIGARRNRSLDTDVHATGKADRSADAHATGKANRTNSDAHATGKASRRSSANDSGALQPFEQRGGNGFRDRMNNQSSAVVSRGWPSEFILDNIKYKNEGILSDNSGEAVIFTVSNNGKKYALKMYYYDPDHRPNHKVLEKIRQLSGSGLLVNIISHGEWSNPNLPGEKNDYELMDFCEGGSLDGVVLEGNEKALAEIAVRMASAIDFLAKHGILHRDIKPANFFYADKAKTQVVLADFGISMECLQGGLVKIDEMRSPVYAAPEFYTNVPGEPAEVGVESDYFSLGVALLCLWMGKDKLTANESQLLRSKLNETLPIPKDMSSHTASLIKALTRLKMSDRATFNDIKRWVKGESLVQVDTAASNADFHIVFNSAKNQVANSPAQLAHLLLDDRTLGKKYVYSGKVTRWLEETGRNEIAVNVEDITERVYPSNQDAGLLAVAYMLDPAMDYEAPDGTHLSNPAEIAMHIYHNRGAMASEVIEKDTRLKVYLKVLKLEKALASLEQFLATDDFDDADENLKKYLSTFYFALLFNDLSFPLFQGDDIVFVESIDDVLDVFREEGDIRRSNKVLIRSQAFIQWLSYRDPALAGKVRMLHDMESNDPESLYYLSSSPYRIAYELDPKADIYFSTDEQDEDRTYTIPEIGIYLNGLMNSFVKGDQDTKEFMSVFDEMDESPLGHYLRARGENYMAFLSWNRFCMDTDNEDNLQKAGPYDMVIGAYKSVAGFLGRTPFYAFGEKIIENPEELKSIPPSDVAAAVGGKVRMMPNGNGTPVAWLDAWLTQFYQENPKLDLSPKFTYEKETAKYVEFIGTIAPDNYYWKRYEKAIKKVDKADAKLKKSEKSVKTKRTLFLILGGVPTLITLICSWFMNAPESNPISGHFFAAFFLCAICLLLSLKVMAGFGASILPALFGGLVCAGIAYAGFQWFPGILYFIGGALLIIGAIVAPVYLFEYHKIDTGGKVISANIFEYRQLDALYYAYHQETDTVDNAVTKYSAIQRDQDAATRDNISFVGWLWIPVAWMIFLLWFFATPQISGSSSWVADSSVGKVLSSQWIAGKWDAKYASGSTRIICNIDSIEDGKKIYGTMVIAGQSPVKAIGTVESSNDTIPHSFSFWPENGSPTKQCIDATYNSADKEMNGTYTDRKGIMHQITFISSPIQGDSKPSPQKSKPKTSVSKPSKHKNEQSAEQSPKQESDNLLEKEESPVSGLWEDTM